MTDAATPAAPQEQVQFSDKVIKQFREDFMRAGGTEEAFSARMAQEVSGGTVKPEPATVKVEGFEAGRMQDFKLPPMRNADGSHDAASHKVMLGGLVAGGFPAGLGSFLAAEIQRTGQKFESLPAAAKDAYKRAEAAKMDRKYGAEVAVERLELATQLVQEIEGKEKGFVDLLNKTGASHSSVVIELLYQHAKRLTDAKYGPGGVVTKREQSAKGQTAADALGIKRGR